MLIDHQLFLGLPLDNSFQNQLGKVSHHVRSLLIQNHPDYLNIVEYQGITYLGKHLGSLVNFSNLELVETHIYSLLRRLTVDYPYEQIPLVLITA